jgi:hypothetical protein
MCLVSARAQPDERNLQYTRSNVPAESSKVFASPRGVLTARLHPGGTLVTHFKGHFATDLLGHYLTLLNAACQLGPALGFLDWYEMDSYDSECRSRMTNWVVERRRNIRGFHILVRSRLVNMGVSTAALLLGGGILHPHTDKDAFGAVCRAEGVEPLECGAKPVPGSARIA